MLINKIIPFSINFDESGRDFGADFFSSNDADSELPKAFEWEKDDRKREADSSKFFEFGIRLSLCIVAVLSSQPSSLMALEDGDPRIASLLSPEKNIREVSPIPDDKHIAAKIAGTS